MPTNLLLLGDIGCSAPNFAPVGLCCDCAFCPPLAHSGRKRALSQTSANDPTRTSCNSSKRVTAGEGREATSTPQLALIRQSLTPPIRFRIGLAGYPNQPSQFQCWLLAGYPPIGNRFSLRTPTTRFSLEAAKRCVPANGPTERQDP